MLSLDSYSLLSVLLDLSRQHEGEVVLSSAASGCLWKDEGVQCLVTNLHNLSGWDAVRGKALSDTGGLPTDVTAYLRYVHDITDQQSITTILPRTFSLYDDVGHPLWWVHPTGKHNYDVAVLPLEGANTAIANLDDHPVTWELATRPVNEADFTDFDAKAGDDAYVLGYPKGLDAGKKLPIWKRASVASEPFVNVGELPIVLVDTATRQGMSGAPVIFIRRGFTIPNGKSFGDGQFGESANFLGVYSGRIGDDELGVQLGRVWKAEVVREILAAKVKGEAFWNADVQHSS